MPELINYLYDDTLTIYYTVPNFIYFMSFTKTVIIVRMYFDHFHILWDYTQKWVNGKIKMMMVMREHLVDTIIFPFLSQMTKFTLSGFTTQSL